MSDVDVAIVGAGISGLAVADGLVRAGRSAQVFEARPVAGGRIRSVDVAGGVADLGPTWFWPGEHRVAQLLRDLDLSFYEQWSSGDALYAVDGEVRRLTTPVMPLSYRFIDGASGIIDGLVGRIPVGVVNLGCPVSRIERHQDHVALQTGNGTVTAASVVMAIPPSLAMQNGMIEPADLEPAVAQTASMTPVWMGGVVKAVAQYSEPFWRHAGLSGSAIAPGQAFNEIHDMSGPDGTPSMLFGFSHSQHADPIEAFVAELVFLFGPKAQSPIATFVADWGSELFTSPIQQPRLPRYDLYGSSDLRTPSWNNRLLWTSTETATVAPGHIEGALAAAERTIRDLTPRP